MLASVEMAMTLRCFLSHPWATNIHHFALRLAAALRALAVDVWLDQEEMLPGQDIDARQHNGIVYESDVFLFVLAPATLSSPNCRAELECAVATSKPIITLVVEPCDVPKEISHTIRVDFVNPIHFDSSVDQLVRGARGLAKIAAIRRRLADNDPNVRAEAIQLLHELADAAAFQIMKRHCAEERDDTVRQYFAQYFALVHFPDPATAEGAQYILRDLAETGGPLTRRAARLASDEHRKRGH